jgi:hypothetical protein
MEILVSGKNFILISRWLRHLMKTGPSVRRLGVLSKLKMIFCGFLIVSLAGCQSWKMRENTKQTVDGVSVLHSSGAEQFSYIKKHKTLVRLCTETDVDVSSTASGGLTLSAKGASVGDTSSKGAVVLGGRDPTVLIARELMFRACELTLNANLKPEDASKIYMGTLNVLVSMIDFHTGGGTQSVAVGPKVVKVPVVAGTVTSKNATASSNPSDPANSQAVPQSTDGVSTSDASINADFSGFTWEDYEDDSDKVDKDHFG